MGQNLISEKVKLNLTERFTPGKKIVTSIEDWTGLDWIKRSKYQNHAVAN